MTERAARPERPFAAWAPWLAALLLVALDAPKPPVIDDTAYVAYARQIAAHPLDPYGFEIFWGERPQRAADVLAPPLLPYWLGGAMALFGENVVAWKLALFPFALALAAAAWSLGRRFAPGLEAPLVWLVVLSPAVTVSFNLMLDVPALALGLCAVAVVARAVERGEARLAVWAGVLAGLALQTKYSACVSLAAVIAYAGVHGRWRLASIAAAVAAALFVGWEAFVSARYGESHFLHHLLDRGDAVAPAGFVVSAVGGLALLGAAAAAPGVLAAAASGVRALAPTLGLAIAAVFAALPRLPRAGEARFELVPDLTNAPPELWLLTALGAAVAAVSAPALHRAWTGGTPRGRFLVLWLVLEAVGFFVLSPFLALRRVIGPVVVLACLAGHAATLLPPSQARAAARASAALGVALGLLFAVADLSDARARSLAFERAVAVLRERGVDPADGRVWFVGHWGFQFQAERAGMRPLVADVSRVAPGDWLLVPSGVLLQRASVPAWARSAQARVEAVGRWPWSTLPNAYGGAVAVRGRPERQMSILLHRIEAGAVARRPRAAEASSAAEGEIVEQLKALGYLE